VAEKEQGLYLTGREDWREWLERNHATEKEVWLIHYKKHAGKPSLSYEDAVEEALCFGWIDGLLRRLDGEKYVLRYTPRKSRSVWSESNRRRAERMIRQGRMMEAGLAKIRQAKASGEWDNAVSLNESVAELPADLEEALAASRTARENFGNMAPSYRKQYIWWITSAKRQDTRERRIRETVTRAELNKKPGID
jgi:uncharacterized protein YdeI (YjbR/CyaY-like superfamily)